MAKLYRSQRDKKIFGLCGGLAESFRVDSTVLRLIVVVTAFQSHGAVVMLYLIASLVIPKESSFNPPFTTEGAPPFPSGPKGNAGSRGGWNEPSATQAGHSSNLDEMMKDVEKKAMEKEIAELKAKLSKLEKGDD